MEIKAQPVDIIAGKIEKIKCQAGCLNNVNYLLFTNGLYCSSCLSTIPQIHQKPFINGSQLAQVLINLIEQYRKQTLSEGSIINLMSQQMENIRNDVRRVKDGLVHDLKIVKEKSFALLDQLFERCQRQNKNQVLETLYQPDFSSSMSNNVLKLVLDNLSNLKISESKTKPSQIEYRLSKSQKNPEEINQQIKQQYEQLDKYIEEAIRFTEQTLENFRKDVLEKS